MKLVKNINSKKIIYTSLSLRLRNKLMYPMPVTYKVSKHLTTAITNNPMMTTYYSYTQECSYTFNEWSQIQAPLLTVLHPVPLIVPTPPQILAPHVCPYTAALVQPLVTPVQQPYVADNVLVMYNAQQTIDYNLEPSYCTEVVENVSETNEQSYYTTDEVKSQTEDSIINDKILKNEATVTDPLEFYLTLPKDLFPPARMMSLDPNPIIDVFCKMANLQHHSPWLLDLEFGVPNSLITRPIPTYNVKFNSIHCKNTPEAIHPGFESCDPDFKRALLFYYDCVVSAWYKGYIIMNHDKSVENFQSWLLLPMQALGMCWP